MSDMMTFPATVEEFMEQYKIVDDEKVYTNGADLVPIFRMMQWFEHVSATDINVGTKISREQLELARAIDGLTEWQKHVQADSNINRDITIAIEALKAQLGTNLAEVGTRAVRGYPIDADALMEKVAEEYGERARDRLYQIIRYMPPAQPEQRTGKWVMNDHIGTFKIFTCSECGWNSEAPFNFCPNCGAKMEGVNNEGN